MKLTTKTTLFSVGLTVVLIASLIVVSLLSFRHFSIASAEEHARVAAEIVRVNLTESMVNGVINKRENFLRRLSAIKGLKEARVVRGPDVIEQYGEGLNREQPRDEIEQRVLSTGKPYFKLIDEGMDPIFRSTIPFIVDGSGDPDCRQCHAVPVGTVLGAVTLTVSIGQLKESALVTVIAMVAAVSLFALGTMLFFRRLTKPLVSTAEEVQQAVGRAIQGDYTTKIERHTNDEIGQIAEDLNHLMDFLHGGLTTISNNVSQLIRNPPSANRNLLTNTIGMVEALIEAAHFKQSIEEDETKREVYCRLARVLHEDFYVERFSIYEVANSKNRMIPIVVDGQPESDCKWCDQSILVRSEACRARRTGHTIDSIETPMICNSFRPTGDPELQHICLPVIQSGSVGSVVQVVVSREEGHHFQDLLPFINVYLREAAPVIEAKRLMDTLRESNLRDPMTGLHNRRFLEEYVETLIANSQRNAQQVSILMLDLDYFKKVNDTYGHDAGDTVIKTLAKVFRQTVRASDLVIRYGGEEFMIILQNTVDHTGDEVAEKIRATVEETKIQVPNALLQKTISIGIADFPTDSDTFWQAVKYADVALYKAKDQGRNRVIHFEPEMWKDAEEY
ncbi:diguanylate cyclase [Endothiovibrio diazotrophicus]